MLETTRESEVEREYQEADIYRKLCESYGKENCIWLGTNFFIVKENGNFYLMKQSIPEIFFTENAHLLQYIVYIEVEPGRDGYVTIKYKKGESSKLSIFNKTRAMEELLQLGI